MRNPAVLYPMFALAAWTLFVLLLIALVRARSARQREIGNDDFGVPWMTAGLDLAAAAP